MNRSFHSKISYWVACILLLFALSSCNSPVNTIDLRCEYRLNPLGIENVNHRLSWKMVNTNSTRGQKQMAYRVLVTSSSEALSKNNGDLWDSGKSESNQFVNVTYEGAALTSGKQAYWKVRIWDMNGEVSDWSEPARFTMGLLNPEDWNGEWIYKEDQEKIDHNWYRKSITINQKASSAFAYVGSFGYYEVYVNGKKVTENVLNPVSSYMKKRIPYDAY